MPRTDQGLSGVSKSVRAVMVHTYQLAGRISIDKRPCIDWAGHLPATTRKLELRGDIPASHMGSRSTTPLLRNPNGCAPLLTARGSECRFRKRGCGGLGI